MVISVYNIKPQEEIKMKGKFKKIIALVLVLIVIIGAVSVGVIYNKKKLRSITLDKTSISLKTGETAKLTATLEPLDTNNTEVKWMVTVGDTIAAVSEDGTVTAGGPGIATIVCESVDKPEISASCQVCVTSEAPKVSAENALVYNVDTGNIIMTKKADSKTSPASLAKILTASVALKYAKADDVFTVGSELKLVKPGSSICQIREGFKLSLQDLICGMLVSSGNDAAYTIAANIARKESGNNMTDKAAIEHFCELMNAYAKEIGMTNSNFTSPDGWDDDEQYTTAADLAILTRNAISIPEIKEVVAYDSKHVTFASGQHIVWSNTNLMLHKDSDFYNEYVTGFKTGSTTKAGKCLISTYESSDESTAGNFVIVVLGCDSDAQRYKDTEKLIKWARENKHA
ncbi:MAG: hypothetical protein E7558_02135 [Ruminococcaceae bacterium]|nr:hypothetical protein [Oscillospiraceae bacterium]